MTKEILSALMRSKGFADFDVVEHRKPDGGPVLSVTARVAGGEIGHDFNADPPLTLADLTAGVASLSAAVIQAASKPVA